MIRPALLIVAVLLFVLAAIPQFSAVSPTLTNVGLACFAASFVVP